MEIYYVICTEYSNGFPYVNCETFKEYKKAYDLYKQYYNSYKDYEYITENDDEFFVEFNNKGCGFVCELISEQDMFDFITDVVDNSKDHVDYKYAGENGCNYIISVPHKKIEWKAAFDFNNFDETYTPLSITRRPYDLEQPNTGEYIYDVYLENNETLDIYVESLELIHNDLFAHIYKDLKGM